MWKRVDKYARFEFHKSQTTRMRFIEHWWHRFVSCRYQFIYKVDVNNAIDFLGNFHVEELLINNHLPIRWLKENARGRIAIVADYVEHMTVGIYLQNGIPVDRTATFTVNFSDKKLALMWKLTWGGKMVDGRKMRLTLK